MSSKEEKLSFNRLLFNGEIHQRTQKNFGGFLILQSLTNINQIYLRRCKYQKSLYESLRKKPSSKNIKLIKRNKRDIKKKCRFDRIIRRKKF